MSCLPDVVLKLTGKNRVGPNCWNATRLYHKADKRPRLVEAEEMEEWLEKNTSRILKREMEVGDIMVMYDSWGLLHTAVMVGPDCYWHKPGISYYRGWEFVSTKEIKKLYPECTLTQYHMVKKKKK